MSNDGSRDRDSSNGSTNNIHTKVARVEERLRSDEAHNEERHSDLREDFRELEKRLAEFVPLQRYTLLERFVFWSITTLIGVLISTLAFFLTRA